MGVSLVCPVVGHRYRYESAVSEGRPGPGWVCRRCGDYQAIRPNDRGGLLPLAGLGGWGGA